MRMMALALMLFAGALVADVHFARLVDAIEATTTKAKRADKQRTKRQGQANKRTPTLPLNAGTGIGTGL